MNNTTTAFVHRSDEGFSFGDTPDPADAVIGPFHTLLEALDTIHDFGFTSVRYMNFQRHRGSKRWRSWFPMLEAPQDTSRMLFPPDAPNPVPPAVRGRRR